MGWRFVFLLGVLPVVAVIAGRYFIRESPRFEQEKQKAPDGLPKPSLRELFLESGAIRRQLFLLAITWVFYGASYVATNFYISYWLTTVKGFSVESASALLLVCGGIGFFFYIIGGLLGERFGRREVIIISGILVAPLSVAMIYVQQHWLLLVMYFLLYQATNGTWSGAGYAYQGESFPTRLRGTAIGFLSAMQVMGFVIGSLLWIGMSAYGKPVLTWLVVATLMSLGMWCTLLLRRITPGQELEAIIA
jgi:predicted MFS family arabinose efflux permease